MRDNYGRGSAFWSKNQPGFRSSERHRGSQGFFSDVERHRYSLEPHIENIVGFEAWSGKEVLEVGCWIGSDGIRFARSGARYTGLDQSEEAIRLARLRFTQEDRDGKFVQGDAIDLPFPDDCFDLIYSHGVIHHFHETQSAVDEFHRVLRPGGQALVMLYHRSSLNYYFTIITVRRLLAAFLMIPGGPGLVARITGEEEHVLEGHKELLEDYGINYLLDKRMFLSNNTDGPGNPLSKVYTSDEARELFHAWGDPSIVIRHLNLRSFPGGRRLSKTAIAEWLGTHWGWHLYVRAKKVGQ